ncbi:MAG: hypothetical protein KDM91_04510, partial [Verrucomicrobiae bacterium]|nr:hypothetical protein [Verrucomicrobiae bacterium]
GGDFVADELGGDLGGDALGKTTKNARNKVFSFQVSVFSGELGTAGVLFSEIAPNDVIAEI